MIKIEAVTLEEAYKEASLKLKCSVTQLKTEVVQHPSSGFLGMFKKSAIIVATREIEIEEIKEEIEIPKEKEIQKNKEVSKKVQETPKKAKETYKEVKEEQVKHQTVLNDTIMPTSFVSDQDDEDDDDLNAMNFTADYDDEFDEKEESSEIYQIAKDVKKDINTLFDFTCFNIDEIDVKVYDETTLLIEFKGEDSALLIGKEGYRYKALSYMLFNWINTKYQIQLRLEIAEFLKNQEETVLRYLDSVKESVDRDGKAQTKILDGVLIQIALKELREIYPDKYVVIRSTRDGLKYIIINDYHTN
ncbi:MAG: Jag N-terminal domain-containing protein [Campylobacterota bacterium]|nr:Jag N-terminal domain-containing protein [Campylobacterota bacterium]